jgi:drug/metabolite transporter (DMT)-like permease
MLGSAAAWAGGVVLSKATLDRTGASGTAVLAAQLTASCLVLAVGCILTRSSLVGVGRAGWLGLLEPGLAYLLSLGGLALTSAASASVLSSLEPAFIPIVALVLFGQRPSAVSVVVLIGATAGSVIMSLGGSTSGNSMVGDVLVVGAVAVAALYVVLSGRHASASAPIAVAFVQQLCALVFVLAALVVSNVAGLNVSWPRGGFVGVLMATASGVTSYALGFWLYLKAIRNLPVAEAGLFLTAIPVFGVLLSVVLLRESVSQMQYLGAAIIVACLVFSATRHDHNIGSSSVDD